MGLIAESGLPLLSLSLRLGLGLRLRSVGMRMLRLLCLRLRMSVFLLAENLQLQEELLLLEESGVGRIHGWRGLLCLLVWRNVLVVLELFDFRLHIFGLLVTVLVGRFRLVVERTRKSELGLEIHLLKLRM